MFKKILTFLVIICFITISFYGCISKRFITRRSQLDNPLETGTITVLTRDGTLYTLDNYQLKDSLLLGIGICKKGGETMPFSGELKLADIDFILAYKRNYLKTAVVIALAAVFTSNSISHLQNSSDFEFSVHEKSEYGGSCPFIYSWDGDHYHFESETFAGAVSKGVEHASYDILHHLKPFDGQYFLMLTNERLETDYINEIKLIAADAPPGIKVIPDEKGDLYTVASPLPPYSCYDFQGKNVLSAVLNKDRRLWESDINSLDLTEKKNLKDGLILEFQKPADARVGKLVVVGGNTPLGTFAFNMLFKLEGENILQWHQKMQHDTAAQMKLKGFLQREGRLHIKVMKAGKWVEQASFPDVGPQILKEQIVTLDLCDISDQSIKIKLESTSDLWRIDRVYMDFSPELALEVEETEPVTAINEFQNDESPLLCADDDLYFVSLPGDTTVIKFNQVPEKPDKDRWYILKSKGYYLQWTEASGKSRDKLVDKILSRPLYGQKIYLHLWRKVKNQHLAAR